eukprot:243450-Pelagomonas_calceolata.AAC.1
MVTERHNIASRILLEGISTGSLGAGLASMDIGRADRLALQNLQIPEHSTNRTLPKFILPCRRGASPGAREEQGALSASHIMVVRGSTLCNSGVHQGMRSQDRVHRMSTTVKTSGPRISLRPPSSSTAIYVAIFQGLQLKLPFKRF